MVKHKTQFIYFDVGGVALLDFSKTNKWNEMLSDLGVTDALRTQFDELFDAHEKKICVGEDINVFISEARSLGVDFPENYDMTADFVNRFEKNNPILELLDKLKNEFQLGLLTGQYPNMLNMIFAKGLLPKDIWNVIIDSSVEGITKPDPEIYLLAEQRAKIGKESILFVDNKAKLLEYPKSRGWQVFEYDPSNATKSTSDLEKLIYNS
jgi:FMN phosphatase YigB (HAD superfamily)